MKSALVFLINQTPAITVLSAVACVVWAVHKGLAP
jgi:hypothetical protein